MGHYLAIEQGDGVSSFQEKFGIEALQTLGEKFEAVLFLSQHTGGRDGHEER
jgi:hypothetical protein